MSAENYTFERVKCKNALKILERQGNTNDFSHASWPRSALDKSKSILYIPIGS